MHHVDEVGGVRRQGGPLGRRVVLGLGGREVAVVGGRPHELVVVLVDQRERDAEAVLLAHVERRPHRYQELVHRAGLDLVTPQLHRSHAADATAGSRRAPGAGRPVAVKIEYHCPTHGKVEPDNEAAPVPTCPMMIRREVDGKVIPETCGQPLTAYMG